MSWPELFLAFVACHLVGDYLLQTEWQARHKRLGLSGDRVARRALLRHGATYLLAFGPALVWASTGMGAWVALIAALIFTPHVVQDDGRLVLAYVRRVKRGSPEDAALVGAVDQAFHAVALFGTALLAASLAS